MIRFVLMDLDDTILDFHRAEAAAVSKTLLRLGVEPTEQIVQRYSEVNAAHWRMLERGEITRQQVLTGRFRQLFSEIGADCDPEQTQQIYEAYLSQGHYFIPGAEQLLKDLSGKYLLYLVSNGNTAVQEGRLKSSGIEPYFEEIFISELIGADKPSKAYFDRCFARIPDFDPVQAILIGDSLRAMRGIVKALLTEGVENENVQRQRGEDVGRDAQRPPDETNPGAPRNRPRERHHARRGRQGEGRSRRPHCQ